MANTHYEDFFRKLLEETKDKKLKWHYLDSNQTLYDGMRRTPSSEINPLTYAIASSSLTNTKPIKAFDVENSYYASIGANAFAVLLRPYNSELSALYVVPNGFKKTIIFTSQNYGDLITRLSNLVEEQFPSAEQAITNYLDNN